MEIIIPNNFSFKDHDIYDFEKVVRIFDWNLNNAQVVINFENCYRANYQTLALIVLYVWFLRSKGCYIEFIHSQGESGASQQWRRMGAIGWWHVLTNKQTNFEGHPFKPLFAIRNSIDFKLSISKAEEYSANFDIEYEKTLRYILSELLYNTLEHGVNSEVPSLIQFNWYKNSNRLSFIIADLGIGIKEHLEQAYPAFEDHSSAILYALNPKVSGTFFRDTPYGSKNNAGAGLYFSSNIIRKLHADMHIVSGNGVVHISPTDITRKTISTSWPGTFINATINLSSDVFDLHAVMKEFRTSANKEIEKATAGEVNSRFDINIFNHFGKYAEDKQSAIKFRESRILPAVLENKTVILDFSGVISAPHSFLNALLSTAIQNYGMQSYKNIKIVNASPEIRETLDYIFDDNTTN